MPSTDSTNRAGRRRMLASANRTRHTKVFPVAGGHLWRPNGCGRIADLTGLHRQGWSGRKVSPTAARNVVGVNSEVLRLQRYCADTTDFVVELSCGGRSLPSASA